MNNDPSKTLPNGPEGTGRPLGRHFNVRRLLTLAGMVALAVGVLWWVDPRESRWPICGLYASTGWHCPGCGATRATHELLHGRLRSALSYNALWVLVAPLALYAGLSEAVRFVTGRPLPGNPFGRLWFIIALLVVATVFGILRNLPFEPFSLLAPPG